MRLHPIGKIETPFTQKFGIPRQGSLAKGIVGIINFEPNYCNIDYLRGIEQFSHLWLTFGFHQHLEKVAQPLVRPPRLGGNEKIGVFASRSSFRPNPLGLSLVKNKEVIASEGNLKLVVEGVDLLCGTPIFDIKPYIPYSDTATGAAAGYASEMPDTRTTVTFTDTSLQQVHASQDKYPDLMNIIITMLKCDPRPAYKKKKSDEKLYIMSVYDLDVMWIANENNIVVKDITHR